MSEESRVLEEAKSEALAAFAAIAAVIDLSGSPETAEHVLAYDPRPVLAFGTHFLEAPERPASGVHDAPAEEVLEMHLGHQPPTGKCASRRASQASTRQAGVRVASTLTRISRPTCDNSTRSCARFDISSSIGALATVERPARAASSRASIAFT